MRRLLTVALLVLPTLGGLSACVDYDWRAAGRASLESFCRGDAGCDRSCESETGARSAGECRISRGQP